MHLLVRSTFDANYNTRMREIIVLRHIDLVQTFEKDHNGRDVA